MNRVALIYGQQHPGYNSHDRQYDGRYHVQNNGSYNSPYLVSVAGDGLVNNKYGGGGVNIARKGKNYLEEMRN